MHPIPCADPEGGGGDRGSGSPPPPWDFSEVGSCVDIWWVGEGVQRLFLSYFYNFFFIMHSVNIWKLRITSKFKMVIRSHVMHTIAGFHESATSMFILSKTHDFTPFKPKNSGGGPPAPPPPHCDITYTFSTFTKLKQSSRMCFCLQKTPRDVYCHTKAE